MLNVLGFVVRASLMQYDCCVIRDGRLIHSTENLYIRRPTSQMQSSQAQQRRELRSLVLQGAMREPKGW